ncbi:MAG TPA: hypothetical protein VMX55_10250 [candidate division Zixibacteria bacterium]|nr:hypothetical protein [candidate division Zixibacteria bacterium]
MIEREMESGKARELKKGIWLNTPKKARQALILSMILIIASE